MNIFSRFKSLLALMAVSVMAATAMPTAASGEQGDSGTLTVTVEVVDDGGGDDGGGDDGGDDGDDGDYGDQCYGSSLEIRNYENWVQEGFAIRPQNVTNGSLAANKESSTPAGEVTIYDLLMWTYRQEENPRAAIAASFGITGDDVEDFMSGIQVSPEHSYSLPWNHPADRDLNGSINAQDVPEFLKTASTIFESPDFEVSFDAGCVMSYEDSYGALFVERFPLERQLSSDGQWESVEITNFFEPAVFDGKGTATLHDLYFDSSDSFAPKFLEVNTPELAALGTWQNKLFWASIDLRGTVPIGSYRTQFFFDLNVGYPSELEVLDNRICSWFAQTVYGCASAGS